MESIAYDVLQMGAWKTYFLMWGIASVVGLLAGALIQLPWKMGRSAYVLSFGFMFFLGGLMSVLSLAVPHALENGYLSLIVAAYYGSLIPIGAFLGITAAARSLDAYGTRNRYILSFIPVVHLLLLFAKPKNRTRTSGMKATGIILLSFILAVAGQLVSMRVMDTIEKRNTTETASDDNEQSRISERYVQLISSRSDNFPEAPVKATKVAVKADTKTLIQVLQIEPPDEQQALVIHDGSMYALCNAENLKTLYSSGAAAMFSYQDKAGKTLDTVTASTSLCEIWDTAVDDGMTAYAASQKTPVKLDEVSTLIQMSYADKTLTRYITLSIAWPDGVEAEVISGECQSPLFQVNVGLTLRNVYLTETGAPLAAISADWDTCQALSNPERPTQPIDDPS